jgi:serine phosphatase RsbU (regulator of sigma subunit)/PAS domain-containing protein
MGDGRPELDPERIPVQGSAGRRTSVLELSLAEGRDQLQLLRAAVEGGLEGMVVVSAAGTMIASNSKFQEIWPIPAEIVATGSDDDALASVLDKLVDPAAFLERVQELYARASGSARDELALRDGRVLDRYGNALEDEAGGYIGWAWYFRDVTSERAAAADAKRLGALVAVAQALGDAGSELDVLSVLSRRGAPALGASGVVLCLADPEAGCVRTLVTNFFDEGVDADVAELPVDFPLPLVRVAVTGNALFLSDRDEVGRLFPAARELYERANTEASAAVPLLSRGVTFGSLSVAFETPKVWRIPDRDLLRALASLTAQALDRLRAQESERSATAAIRRLSETLQRSLLTAPPRSEAMQIAVRYQPAAQEAQVGGDWYDAFPTAQGCTTLVVGDVAGHDRDAAAGMAQVRNVLRGIAQSTDGPPGAVLSGLDRALSRLQMSTLATAVLCQVVSAPPGDPAGAFTLRWSNAGHPPPVLVHADGTARLLERTPELLLGMEPATPRSDGELLLEPGSTVILYSDGLIERRDQSLDDGLEQLLAAAAELHTEHPDAICDGLLSRLATGSEDDVALLVMKLTG